MNKNNQVKLTGNFTQEARVIKKDDKEFVAVSIATTDSYKDDDGWHDKEPVFHNNIITFNKVAMGIAKSLKTGSRVEVNGSLSYRRKEHEGKNKTKIITYEATIIADKIEQKPLFKKSRPANDNGTDEPTSSSQPEAVAE